MWSYPPQRFRGPSAVGIWFSAYDGNLKILCDLGSYIEWSIYFRGYYDPDLSMVLKRLAAKGMVAIDAGANVGAYSLLLAKAVGDSGRILAFEPNPEVHDRLCRNIKANGFQRRVDASRKALSSERGWAVMFGPRKGVSNRGVASLYQHAMLQRRGFRVHVGTIDDEVLRRGIRKVDLIKIDAEGNDVRVLEGAMVTITRHRPRIIFEVSSLVSKDFDARLRRARQALSILGYSFSIVGFHGRLRRLGQGTPFPQTNIVCLPPPH
jgi:FkbM family methyltransferase